MKVLEGLLQTQTRASIYQPFDITPLFLTELRLSQFCEKWFLDNEQSAFCKILKGTGRICDCDVNIHLVYK